MKKNIILFAIAVAALASCKGTPEISYDIDADRAEMKAEVKAANAQEIAPAEIDKLVSEIYAKYYERHLKDSLGLEAFSRMASYYCEPQTLQKYWESADTLIKNNARIQKSMQANEVKLKTASGPYIDVKGICARGGVDLAISDILAKGKPVIVDFWASWCPDCRRGIQNEMATFYEENKDKVNIVGVAVWEKKIEDTQKAMEELPVPWTVIYAGGRENSPADFYGVTNIPTLILIGADGNILARGTYIDELLPALQ